MPSSEKNSWELVDSVHYGFQRLGSGRQACTAVLLSALALCWLLLFSLARAWVWNLAEEVAEPPNLSVMLTHG